MAFSDSLDTARPDWIYLLEIEVGHRIDGDTWIQHGTYTNCWYITHGEGKPSKVEEDGSALTEQSGWVDTNNNPGSWYWGSASSILVVHVADSGDPGDGGQTILSFFWEYFCNKQPESNQVIFNSAWYLPYLNDDEIPPIDFETTGYHEGGTRQSFGSVKLINADGYFDTRLTDYIYEAKKLLWKVGRVGDSYADFAVLWRGWTGSVGWSDEEIEITIEDMRKFF